MQIKRVDTDGESNVKTFKMTHGNETAKLRLRYVPKTEKNDEIQAVDFIHNGIIYETWREHGSFLKLVNSKLGSNLDTSHGMRKKYFDDWFYNYE